MWRGDPSTMALTRRTLGFQVRLDLLWEWETLIPKVTPFPQMSHFAMSLHLLFSSGTPQSHGTAGKVTVVFYQMTRGKARAFFKIVWRKSHPARPGQNFPSFFGSLWEIPLVFPPPNRYNVLITQHGGACPCKGVFLVWTSFSRFWCGP